jgi:hypothetical protein
MVDGCRGPFDINKGYNHLKENEKDSKRKTWYIASILFDKIKETDPC